MYFVRSGKKQPIFCERHRIKIPTLNWVRLEEKGYIPTNSETYTTKGGTVSIKAGKYYVSVLVEEPELEKPVLNSFRIGIDLGIKEFAVCSNGRFFANINKSVRIRKLEKRSEPTAEKTFEEIRKLKKYQIT